MIASLVFQATGVPPTAAQSMLQAIEEIKFFLQTAFGNSTCLMEGGIQFKINSCANAMIHHQQPGEWSESQSLKFTNADIKASHFNAQFQHFRCIWQGHFLWTIPIQCILICPIWRDLHKCTTKYKSPYTTGGDY